MGQLGLCLAIVVEKLGNEARLIARQRAPSIV